MTGDHFAKIRQPCVAVWKQLLVVGIITFIVAFAVGFFIAWYQFGSTDNPTEWHKNEKISFSSSSTIKATGDHIQTHFLSDCEMNMKYHIYNDYNKNKPKMVTNNLQDCLDCNPYLTGNTSENSKIFVPFGKNEYCLFGTENNNKYNYKYLSITGMYDTGTNALYDLLQQNCYGKTILKQSFETIYSNFIQNNSNPLDLSLLSLLLNNDDDQDSDSNLNINITQLEKEIREKFDNPMRRKVEYLSELDTNMTIEMLQDFLFGNDGTDGNDGNDYSGTRGKYSDFVQPTWRPRFNKHNMNPTNGHDLTYILNEIKDGEDMFSSLTVVVIKDPLTWFMSVCKASYGVRFNHYKRNTKKNDDNCPTGLSKIADKNKLKHGFDKLSNITDYQSSLIWQGMYWNNIVTFWNQWYQSFVKNGKTISFQNPVSLHADLNDVIEIGLKNYHTLVKNLKHNKKSKNGEYNWANLKDDDSLNATFDQIMTYLAFNGDEDRRKQKEKDDPASGEHAMFLLTPEQAETMSSIGHTLIDRAIIPTVIVRMEDILFQPKKIVNFLCDCVGGIKRKNIYVQESKVKPNTLDRTGVFDKYANADYRYSAYTQQDINFMKNNLDSNLLQFFGYNIK